MIYAALLALSAAGVSGVAIDSEPTATVVRFGDLDLGTARGRSALERRIARAVDKVCDEPGRLGAERQSRVARCKIAANARVRGRVEQALGGAGRSPAVAQELASGSAGR